MTKKEFLVTLGHVLYPDSKEIYYNASSPEVTVSPLDGTGYGFYIPSTYVRPSRDKYTEIAKVTLVRGLKEFTSEEVERVQDFMRIMCPKFGCRVIEDGRKLVILINGDYPWNQVTYIGVS